MSRGDPRQRDCCLAPHSRASILERSQQGIDSISGRKAAERPGRLPFHAFGRESSALTARPAAAFPWATSAFLTAGRTSPF